MPTFQFDVPNPSLLTLFLILTYTPAFPAQRSMSRYASLSIGRPRERAREQEWERDAAPAPAPEPETL